MTKILKCSAIGCAYTSTMKASFTRHKNSHKNHCKPRIHVKISCPIEKCLWTGYESHRRKHLRKEHNEQKTLKEIRSNSEGKLTESNECSKSSNKSKMLKKKKGAKIMKQEEYDKKIKKKANNLSQLELAAKSLLITTSLPKSFEVKNVDEIKCSWIKERLAEESSNSIEISAGSHTGSEWKLELKSKYGRSVPKKKYFNAQANIMFS